MSVFCQDLKPIHDDALLCYLCQHVKRGSTVNTEYGKESESLFNTRGVEQRQRLSKTHSINLKDRDSLIH